MSNNSTKPLSGFPEYLPSQQIVFNRMISIIRSNFELYGFAPLETPSVERKETLIAKGGDEKEIYALSRLRAGEGEDSETEMALHFDLTVPLARYVSMHQNDLAFPFKRYQIQKVWRGERPQSGRFREFYQCDIDVIGREKLSLHNDAELPAVIYKIFKEMELGDFVISINNRKFIQGYLLSVGVKASDIPQALHIIDKRDKVGQQKMVDELTALLTATDGATIARTISEFFVIQTDVKKAIGSYAQSHSDTVKGQGKDEKINDLVHEGAAELLSVYQSILDLGVPQDHIAVDLGIVRGLDYYTGTVYETTLSNYPELGSVCSGGRYENLAQQFSASKLPGVGISIGLSRIMAYLFAQDVFDTTTSTPSRVLVTSMDEAYGADYSAITALLRNAFIPTEMYTESGKFEKQLKYAHAKGIRFVVIMGEDEKKKESVLIKDLTSGDQYEVAMANITSHLLEKF